MSAPPAAATLDAHLRLSLGAFTLDVQLRVDSGTTLVLVGPNGAGKTTCLEALAGLRAIDSGRIVLGSEVLADPTAGIDVPPEHRRIGYLFQDFALFPHLTVRGNVAYGPRARRVPTGEARARVDAALERFELAPLADRRVAELSGGQKQRVALARALASEARLLLLDEPFASLDAGRRGALRAELRSHLNATGLPAIVVTHDAADAAALGGRLAVLEQGRVAGSGSLQDLLAHPPTPFMDLFAGSRQRDR